MSFNDVQTLFDMLNRISFKLYSLEHPIEKKDTYVEDYAIDDYIGEVAQ